MHVTQFLIRLPPTFDAMKSHIWEVRISPPCVKSLVDLNNPSYLILVQLHQFPMINLPLHIHGVVDFLEVEVVEVMGKGQEIVVRDVVFINVLTITMRII